MSCTIEKRIFVNLDFTLFSKYTAIFKKSIITIGSDLISWKSIVEMRNIWGSKV